MLTAGIPTAPPRASGRAGLRALPLLLVLLAVLAWSAIRSPAPSTPSAAPELDRMLGHVQVLAAAPRPIATRTNAQARDYIVAQLRGMGLDPQVQQTTVQKSTIRYWGGTDLTLGRISALHKDVNIANLN